MSIAVNLLPAACAFVRVRSRRLRGWCAAGALSVLIFAGAWLFRVGAGRAADRMSERVVYLETRQADVQRHLALVFRDRNQILNRVRHLAALNQEEPLPAQLVELARAIPEGVFLTEFQGRSTAQASATLAPSPAAAAPPGAKAPARPAKNAPPRPDPVPVRTATVSGYALTHADVTQMIELIRRVHAFDRVELQKSSAERFRDVDAIAFRIECQQTEGAP